MGHTSDDMEARLQRYLLLTALVLRGIYVFDLMALAL